MNLSNSWWNSYEQLTVILSLLMALIVAAAAFVPTKLKLSHPFTATLTWDFTRSWATNVSGLAGVMGVAAASSIAADFKPFTQAAVKNSYTAATVLMAAIVVAAPSIYTLLQVRKDNQLVGCAGGFIAASTLTIWGTIAQLLLQTALLLGFVSEKLDLRFGLLLVPAILIVGLILLVPYSIKSIQVALINETQAPAPTPIVKSPGLPGIDKLQAQIEPAEILQQTAPVRRSIALL